MKKAAFLIILSIILHSCAQYVKEVDHVVADNMRISERLTKKEDSSIAEMISPYKSQLDAEMNEVLAVTDVDLIKDSPESTLGNWFADILMAEAVKYDDRVSFALQNRGGVRINSIKSGEITRGKIYELMPFDNFLVIMQLKGTVLSEFVSHIAEDGGWPTSKELRVKKIGEKVEIAINGDEIEPQKTYWIALPDYVANGGSDSKMIMSEPQTDTGDMIRDILIRHLSEVGKSGRPMTTTLDQRFVIKD